MLRLTKKADYSLIALRHFAARQQETGEAVSAKEVSDGCGIPLPVLSKLLQKLGNKIDGNPALSLSATAIQS